MTRDQLRLWISLSVLGLLGVASMMLSDLIEAFNMEMVMPANTSPQVLKLLFLVNPSITVIITAFIGCLVYAKVGLRVPVFESLLNIRNTPDYSYWSIVLWGILIGSVGGMLVISMNYFFTPLLPYEYLDASNVHSLHIVSKLLYGGIVEEIMMRFGLMSVVVWILFKLFKKLRCWMFETANIIIALLFAVGHLPALWAIVPDPTVWLYMYILLANGVLGIIYGYMYIKRGLESAMIAHMMTHIVMHVSI